MSRESFDRTCHCSDGNNPSERQPNVVPINEDKYTEKGERRRGGRATRRPAYTRISLVQAAIRNNSAMLKPRRFVIHTGNKKIFYHRVVSVISPRVGDAPMPDESLPNYPCRFMNTYASEFVVRGRFGSAGKNGAGKRTSKRQAE